MNRPIRLLIVDDHPFFRQGVKFYLSSLPEFELLGECSNGEEALEIITATQPDIILMDLKMPGIDGISATQALLSYNPGLRILILTSFGSEDQIREAVNAGAAGYCLKDAPPDELVTAIKAVAEGGTYLGRGVDLKVLAQATNHRHQDDNSFDGIPDSLTLRELDVLRLLAEGLGNKEIAQKLIVSEKTVKTHVANILHKLGVKTRTQAALLAKKQDLL